MTALHNVIHAALLLKLGLKLCYNGYKERQNEKTNINVRKIK